VLIGSDLLRLCREDLIQICGTADGIRLYNSLQAKYDFFPDDDVMKISESLVVLLSFTIKPELTLR